MCPLRREWVGQEQSGYALPGMFRQRLGFPLEEVDRDIGLPRTHAEFGPNRLAPSVRHVSYYSKARILKRLMPRACPVGT
jgi:hypothetical protein